MAALPKGKKEALLEALRLRFEANMARHASVDWPKVRARLEAAPDKLLAISQMERTGGEPDVVAEADAEGAYLFVDCSPETPGERRSVCYDPEALESRKKHKPAHSAIGMAAEMGVEILDEDQYRALQECGQFDTRTSSWLRAPSEIRALGGAIFGDRRFGRVFVYHNGAESYYAGRGFRCSLRV